MPPRAEPATERREEQPTRLNRCRLERQPLCLTRCRVRDLDEVAFETRGQDHDLVPVPASHRGEEWSVVKEAGKSLMVPKIRRPDGTQCNRIQRSGIDCDVDRWFALSNQPREARVPELAPP